MSAKSKRGTTATEDVESGAGSHMTGSSENQGPVGKTNPAAAKKKVTMAGGKSLGGKGIGKGGKGLRPGGKRHRHVLRNSIDGEKLPPPSQITMNALVAPPSSAPRREKKMLTLARNKRSHQAGHKEASPQGWCQANQLADVPGDQDRAPHVPENHRLRCPRLHGARESKDRDGHGRGLRPQEAGAHHLRVR